MRRTHILLPKSNQDVFFATGVPIVEFKVLLLVFVETAELQSRVQKRCSKEMLFRFVWA